jgi:hypothetical protein
VAGRPARALGLARLTLADAAARRGRFRPHTVLALLAPGVAWGNVPAAYVFIGALHLVLGCALLGLVEGWLIARLFKTPPRKTILSLVFANYFSAAVGVVFLLPLMSLIPASLNHVTAYVWTSVAVYFLATVIVEWPFVFALFKTDPRWLPRSIQASLVAQGATYGALILLYAWGGWQQNLDRVDRDFAAWAEPRTVVYFLAPDDRALYRIRLKDAKVEPVLELPARGQRVHLQVARSSPGADGLDLRIGDQVVLRNVGRLQSPAEKTPYEGCPDPDAYHCLVDLRPGTDGDWHVRSLYARAIEARNERSGAEFYVGMETIFLRFSMTGVTSLPGNQVLFQARSAHLPWRDHGRPQICLLDLETRKLAVIAEGHSPVAFVESPPGR